MHPLLQPQGSQRPVRDPAAGALYPPQNLMAASNPIHRFDHAYGGPIFHGMPAQPATHVHAMPGCSAQIGYAQAQAYAQGPVMGPEMVGPGPFMPTPNPNAVALINLTRENFEAELNLAAMRPETQLDQEALNRGGVHDMQAQQLANLRRQKLAAEHAARRSQFYTRLNSIVARLHTNGTAAGLPLPPTTTIPGSRLLPVSSSCSVVYVTQLRAAGDPRDPVTEVRPARDMSFRPAPSSSASGKTPNRYMTKENIQKLIIEKDPYLGGLVNAAKNESVEKLATEMEASAFLQTITTIPPTDEEVRLICAWLALDSRKDEVTGRAFRVLSVSLELPFLKLIHQAKCAYVAKPPHYHNSKSVITYLQEKYPDFYKELLEPLGAFKKGKDTFIDGRKKVLMAKAIQNFPSIEVQQLNQIGLSKW